MTSKYIDALASYDTRIQISRTLIAGLGKTPSYATVEASNGEAKRLEIVELESKYFVIQKLNLNIGNEWTMKIIFNGVQQSLLCAYLPLVALMINILLNA